VVTVLHLTMLLSKYTNLYERFDAVCHTYTLSIIARPFYINACEFTLAKFIVRSYILEEWQTRVVHGLGQPTGWVGS